MAINVGDNFSYQGKKYLDNRQSFKTLSELQAYSNVPEGFIAYCEEDKKRYEYVDGVWTEYVVSSSGTTVNPDCASKAYVDELIESHTHDEYLTEHQDISHLATKDEIPSIEGLATETYVQEQILNASLDGGEVDLSNYVTEQELEQKGYLTEHQDLSAYATKEYVDEAISNIDVSGGDNTDIDLSDYVTNAKLQEGLANKFDNVEVNEVETNDSQTALDFYANGEVVKTVYFSGGGGGSAIIPPYISTILPENSILGLGGVFNLQLDFSSSVTGRGTAKIFVNDVDSISMSIPQGENTIPMADTYFTKGNNRVTVYVIDRTGQMSNSLTFYVRYGSLEITSDFDAYTAYEPGAVVRYYFTPTAVDTSLSLTMYMKIDGEVKDGVSCYSDTRGYFTFPNNLEVGAHFCQAYVMDSAGSTSNVLTFNLIILDDVSIVVASDTVNPIVEEGEQLSLDYKVYMRGNTSFITKTYIDENLVNTGTCGLDFAYYRTSALTEGVHTIKMEVYDVRETVSDYIIWTVTVTPSTYAMLQPVKAGSLFIGTAQNMTNSSENKEVWRGTDQDGAVVDGILHNFAFNSESGWVDDELLISGASSVEIPITPLANNARYGFTLDIEFASKMIGVSDALVLKLWDDEKDCGIKITTEQVILRSAEGNQADLYFTDSEMTSVIFVIDRNEATAKIYLNGVMCSAFHLSDYSIDGVPYLEDFTVNNTIMLGGSGHARIKNLRVYQVALGTDEILNNFMANETRKAEQKALVEFQKGDHLPTLTIYCDFSGLGKDDKKPCAITYVSTDEEKYGKSFTLTHKKSTCQYQGTSSMAYPIKNYRINLADETGEKWKYDFPYGQPERRFTLKADFMSSGHWTNTGLTKWINKNLYNYDLDDEKTMNPKKWYDINNGGSIDDTRECIYGFPCRLILVNDGNTPLNEGQNEPTPGNTKDMGIFNFNHDKDATDTMGFDDDVFPNCASYEVTANSDTSAGAFMKYDANRTPDMTELEYITQSFELRFPDEDDVPKGWGFMGIPGEEGTGLKVLIDWVDTCTDEEFVRDFDQHFNRDYTLRYFLLVITLGMVDNLGKNMMLDTWDNKIFMPRFYDCDTICSYDNSGQLKFDVDIEMAQGYWNTSSSRLWTRIRDLMHDELIAKYNDMRQNGLSYESLMECFYDEQIAKIPQKYYNMDYDVKYGPFADSYIGMANGDTYEHLKRWLQQRLRFVDTLYDYAPSYNNDVLTIRANTTEPMTLEIETYTPVYQHLSWYNNQMDKKKIDGKVSVTFTGTAMAATDQEVLIYGGSNIKSIKGISSMNPNRMLIGSATRLIELDAPNCPLLADINANKANLAPHIYLNKVNLSGCPLLGGNLIVNQSPLVREIDIRGTSITGLNLPPSLRNLEILKLPAAISSLVLNDAGQLHTLEFDEGGSIQSVAMTNCNALTTVKNFNLEDATSVTLNNSYSTAAELYFSKATNLSVSNMPNLERLVYTPNAEYEVFDKANVDNASNYTISTFNCPKLSTFMTTAPYRESFNNCGMVDKEVVDYIEKDYRPEMLKDYEIENSGAGAGDLYAVDGAIYTDFIEVQSSSSYTVITGTTEATVLRIAEYDENKKYIKINNGNYELDITTRFATKYIRISVRYPKYIQVNGLFPTYGYIQVKDYGNIQPNTTFTANSIDISSTQFTDVKLLCTTDINTLKLPTTVKNFYCDSSFDLDTDYLEDGEYDVVHGELVEHYTTDHEGEIIMHKTESVAFVNDDCTFDGRYFNTNGVMFDDANYATMDYIQIVQGSIVYSTHGIYRVIEYDANKQIVGIHDNKTSVELNSNCRYIRYTVYKKNNQEVYLDRAVSYTPNPVPSSADGSLIFSMYAPRNTVAPASGTWDLKGLEFDNFHTFGMNNDVKPVYSLEYIQNKDLVLMEKFYYNYTTMHSGAVGAEYSTPYIKVNKGDTISLTTSDSSTVKCFYSTDYDELTGKATSQAYDGINRPSGRVYTIDNVSQCLRGFSIANTVEWFDLTINNITVRYTIADMPKITDVNDAKFKEYYEPFGTIYVVNSITMPARYDDYNITIKNANISPKTHNTMLYPLLVNEDNPITGTLDYTNYDGKHLSWSFAYTDEEYVDIIQPKDELLNSYEYRYNAFYDTEYEFENPYEIAKYTSSVSGVLPSFNEEFTYTYDEIDNRDGTYTTKIYTDSLDILPTRISFATKPVIRVDKLNTSQATNLNGLFQNCSSLEYVNTENWNTTNVSNMTNMFHSCSGLTSLDLSGFDTTNVSNMTNMFYSCSGLTSLDLSGFDTSKITDMHSMFSGCSGLTSLDVSGFDTKNVTNMSNMFYSCSGLTSLDVSGFDTGNVTKMSGMFRDCSGLTSLDVSGFDTKNVTTMENMFFSCSGLTSLDLSGFDTGNVTNMHSMFYNCWSLKEVKGIENWDCSKVAKFGSMFQGATAFGGDLDLRNWKVGQNTTVTEIYGFMNGCTNLKSIDMSGWVLPDSTNFADFMGNQGSLHTVKVIGWSDITIQNLCGAIGWYVGGTIYGDVLIDERYLENDWVYEHANNVLEIVRYTSSASGILPTFNNGFTGYSVSEKNKTDNTYTVSILTDSLDNLPTSINFSKKSALISVDHMNASKVTDATYMFSGCSSLTSLDLSGLNTSNVTAMTYMFHGCSSLTSLDLSGFNTTNVTAMTYMFQNCSSLTSLDLSGFNTTNVTAMNSMFSGCSGLTSLDVSGFDTKNVTNMSNMFYSCSGLTSLDLSGFDTGNVTNMSNMFSRCMSLEQLKGNFVLNDVNCTYMFDRCDKGPDLSEFKMSGTATGVNYMFGSFGSNGTPLAISLDLSDITLAEGCEINSYTFFRCVVKDIYPFRNINSHCDLTGINLSQEVLLRFIDNLAETTTSPTLKLGSANLDKLSEDQIAIATNKGWTVS